MFNKVKKIVKKPFFTEEKVEESKIEPRTEKAVQEDEFSLNEYIESKKKEIIQQPINVKEQEVKSRVVDSFFTVALLLSFSSIFIYLSNDTISILLMIISISLYVLASSNLKNEANQYIELKEIRKSHELLNKSYTLFKTCLFMWSINIFLLQVSLFISINFLIGNVYTYQTIGVVNYLILYGIALLICIVIFIVVTIKRKNFKVI